MRHVFLILGMHRSGTSALTRALSLMGAALPRRMVPPADGNNELGFWEPLEIALLHDRILSMSGSSWDDYRELPEGFFSSASGVAWQQEASELIKANFGDAESIVLKEPRICRLLPGWKVVLAELGYQILPVIQTRHPMEVAQSLFKRDGIPFINGVLLWLRHNLEAEYHTRGMRRSWVNFNDLLRDPIRCIQQVFQHLGKALPDDREQRFKAIGAFISPQARHQHADSIRLDNAHSISDWANDAYSLLCDPARVDSVESRQRLDEIRCAFNRLSRLIEQLMNSREAQYLTQARSLQSQLDDAVKNVLHRDDVLEQLRHDRNAEQLNAEAQIRYRDDLLLQIDHDRKAEQLNAEAQIRYRDDLVEQLRGQIAAEKTNAYEQITYRDAMISDQQATLSEYQGCIDEHTQRIDILSSRLNNPFFLMKHLLNLSVRKALRRLRG